MDKRRIKRLAVILVMAIVAIMFFKHLLTRAVTNLGNAAMTKKHAVTVQHAPTPASDIPLAETPISATGAAEDSGMAVSSVESTAY